MCTILYSQEGIFSAKIDDVPNSEDDGFHFRVDMTGKEFDSQRKAIRHARSYLKKKRKKYYKKHPNKKPWVKRQRIYPKVAPEKHPLLKTIHKLYKMEKDTAKILTAYSRKGSKEQRMKLNSHYSKKKWGKKTVAVSGEPEAFAITIADIMKNGSKKERKAVSKMVKSFMSDKVGKNGNYIFY